MNDTRAAVRYARAILDLAVDRKAADAVEKDMRSVTKTLSDSKELRTMLASPVLKSEAKKGTLAVIFKGVHPISEGLFGILADNGRIGMLNQVAEKFIILNEDRKGNGVAHVVTAVPLTPELENKILERITDLTGKKVAIENKVDERIVGGFILRIGDLQYDASIANKLGNLKREFTNSL